MQVPEDSVGHGVRREPGIVVFVVSTDPGVKIEQPVDQILGGNGSGNFVEKHLGPTARRVFVLPEGVGQRAPARARGQLNSDRRGQHVLRMAHELNRVVDENSGQQHCRRTCGDHAPREVR